MRLGRRRARGVLLVLGAGILAASIACEREQRRFQEGPPAGATASGVAVSELYPGAQPPTSPNRSPYLENAWAISQGKQLFMQMNCSGCHANGGGGMGPALIDHRWIYGSDPDQIHATIVQGRPNGMPSFRGKLTEQQVWQLTAFVRSLSGLAPKDASGGRSDHMNAKPSEQSISEAKPKLMGSLP